MNIVKKQKLTVFTIGHSTHTIEEFIALLQQYGITRVVDIRTIPKSRHNPQFNKDVLKQSLKNAHIKYIHIKNLGGLRSTNRNSINTAWHNKSFRGYADYMQTKTFQKGLEQLLGYIQKDQVAIMCAEAVPWRCHRSLVGDALLIRGVKTKDIFSRTSVKPHKLTPWAHVQGDTITYPLKVISPDAQ